MQYGSGSYGYYTSGGTTFSAPVFPAPAVAKTDTQKGIRDAEKATRAARKQLKKAHDAHRAQKKADRQRARLAAKRKRAHEAGLAALHDIAKTGHRDASDARVEAARLLLEYGKGNY